MRQKKTFLPALNILLIVSAVIFYIMPFLNRGLVRDFFSRGGYYLTALLVLSWVLVLLQCLRRYKPDPKLFMRSYGYGLMLSFIISSFTFISVEPHFRVLSDETNLLCVSKSMLYEKRADNVTMGSWRHGVFYPISMCVDKRPLVFPFFTHILHVLLGFRAENAFVLNYLVLLVLLFLIYAQVKNYLGGNIWPSCAVLLVASQPIVIQDATSGGFDLTAALFMVICFICLRWFLDGPTAIRFQLMWINLVMLANIRYEGIVFFFIALGFLWYFKYLKPEFFKAGAGVIYFLTPIMLLPIYWQKFLINNPFQAKGAAFSIDSFLSNTVIFLKTLFRFDFFLPYASFINVIALAALLYFIYLFFVKRAIKEKNRHDLVVISVACIAVNWVTCVSYQLGKADHPSTARFFVIFFIVFSILVVMLANCARSFRQNSVYLLAPAVLIFLLYHPVSIKDRFSGTQVAPRKYDFVVDFLKKQKAKNQNFLVIAGTPSLYAARNYWAVDFGYANTKRSVIDDYNKRLYVNIFVIQDINYKTGRPEGDCRLNEKFVLETVAQSENSGDRFTRISKVTSILPDGKPI